MIRYFKKNVKIETMMNNSIIFSPIIDIGEVVLTLGEENEITITNNCHYFDDCVEGVYLTLPSSKHRITTSFQLVAYVLEVLHCRAIDGKSKLQLQIRTGYRLFNMTIEVNDINALERYNITIPQGNIFDVEDELNLSTISLEEFDNMCIEDAYKYDPFVQSLNVFNKLSLKYGPIEMKMDKQLLDSPAYDDDLMHIVVDDQPPMIYNKYSECFNFMNEYTTDKIGNTEDGEEIVSKTVINYKNELFNMDTTINL